MEGQCTPSNIAGLNSPDVKRRVQVKEVKNGFIVETTDNYFPSFQYIALTIEEACVHVKEIIESRNK